MADWEDAWLNGRAMPPNNFPRHLIVEAQTIAEEWYLHRQHIGVITEWVETTQADLLTEGLLWNGFRVRGRTTRRERPAPVLVRLQYLDTFPDDNHELHACMYSLFLQAFNEWVRGYVRYGDDFITAL